MALHLHISALQIAFLAVSSVFVLTYRLFRVPRHLRHIPAVPVWPLLHSYLSGEVEEQRVKRLVLPFAKEMRTDVVLVFCLGDWMVQVLEPKLGKQLLESSNVLKKRQSPHMLLWRLIGNDNVFMSNGDMAKRHLRIVRDALHQTTPVDIFAALARKTMSMLGEGGRVRWSDYANRYTLDAFGIAVIGYKFDAITKPHGSFVQRYNDVMKAIGDPPYIALPILERLLPRWGVQRMIDSFVDDLCKILQEKRHNPGKDVVTYMFQEPEMTEVEFRDNCSVMFVAGHDTTAGAVSSVVYFLARYPEIQTKARAEVVRVLEQDEPLIEHYFRTPYLNAVLCESMRCNTPSNVTLPRVSDDPMQIGEYVIPPNTSMVFNMCAAHYNDSVWHAPEIFDPERFLCDAKGEAGNWVTFGIGPRRCLAKNFSLYEQRVLVSMLLREYEWSLPDDSVDREFLKNGFSPFALSLPDNLDVNFVRVSNEPAKRLS